MKLTKNTIELICNLEHIIGDECYNPNSLNGWTLEEGCSFRYPVVYKNSKGIEVRTRGTISDMDKERINSMRYKFGSNHLYVGSAIRKALEHLEAEYGIDFNELAKAKKK